MTVHRLVPRFPEPVVKKWPASVSIAVIFTLSFLGWAGIVAAILAVYQP